MSRFSILLVAAATIGTLCLCAGDVNAQGRGGWGGMNSNRISLLSDESVKEAIVLVDEQADDVEKLQSRMRDEMRQQFSGMREKFQDMRNMSQDEREDMMAEMQEKVAEVVKDVESELEGILVPHQMDQLGQIYLQSIVRRNGGNISAVLKDEGFAEAMNLSDSDTKKLEKSIEEAEEWKKEEKKRIDKEAQEKAISVLTSEQRETFNELFGEPHEFQERGRGGRGGAGGDRRGGGAGGDRRGGGAGGDRRGGGGGDRRGGGGGGGDRRGGDRD